jgi:MSHA pilin protein MshD
MKISTLKKQIRGYTLIELVMSMTIIAIAILGTLMAVNTAALYSGDPLITYQAISIAESYLTEIASKSFPSGTCPSGSRSTYTSICQYNGLNQVPTDQTGAAIAGLGGYTVQVTVDSATAQLGTLTAGTQAARIDVTVSHKNMDTMTFSTYRTNY